MTDQHSERLEELLGEIEAIVSQYDEGLMFTVIGLPADKDEIRAKIMGFGDVIDLTQLLFFLSKHNQTVSGLLQNILKLVHDSQKAKEPIILPMYGPKGEA